MNIVLSAVLIVAVGLWAYRSYAPLRDFPLVNSNASMQLLDVRDHPEYKQNILPVQSTYLSED